MKYCIVIIIAFISFKIFGQEFEIYDELTVPEVKKKFQLGREIHDGYEIFNNNGYIYRSKKGLERFDENNITPSYLKVRTLDMKNNVLNESIIKDNDIDSEHSSFDEKYLGERNFVIIRSRFSFHILNLTTDIVIEPEYSIGRDSVEIGDGQDLNLGVINIFDSGQYLIFNQSSFGTFCLNLLDLYNPVLVDAVYVDPPMSSEYYIFLDHRKDGIYNVISVKRTYREIENIEYLFKGYHFNQDDNGEIIYETKDDQYLNLQQIGKDGKTYELIIDYINGTIVTQ